jgi:hypothetical protein
MRRKHPAGRRVNRALAGGTARLPKANDADNNDGDADNTALTNGAL